MSHYSIELADAKDDEQLRNVLANNYLNGEITVSFRKSPSFFAASSINGRTQQIIKCTYKPLNSIVGMGSRSVYPAYINGECVTIGYLSDLRINSEHRNRLILAKGYQFLEQLHVQQPLSCYLTMIYSENTLALESIAANRAGLPHYNNMGSFITPAIFLDLPKSRITLSKVTFETAKKSNIDQVFSFLQRCHKNKQFAPYYTTTDLTNGRLKCLKCEDIYLAIQNNQIIGMASAWDQSSFRQIMVEQYSSTLAKCYPFYNALATITPLKALPKPGTQIPFFYLAMIAIENNNNNVFRALLRHIYRDRVRGPWNYFICGLHSEDPLASILTEYRKINSYGQLFYIDYSKTLKLDKKIPYIECSTL